MNRRITVKPGRGATVNGLPGSKYWNGHSVIVSGEFDFEVEDLDNYVQVQFPSTSYLYTYRDPSGTLRVDDIVQVPTINSYATNIGVVARLGRGNWDGPTKDITARLQREVF